MSIEDIATIRVINYWQDKLLVKRELVHTRTGLSRVAIDINRMGGYPSVTSDRSDKVINLWHKNGLINNREIAEYNSVKDLGRYSPLPKLRWVRVDNVEYCEKRKV